MDIRYVVNCKNLSQITETSGRFLAKVKAILYRVSLKKVGFGFQACFEVFSGLRSKKFCHLVLSSTEGIMLP